jgi:hypothetical protein
MLPAAVLSGNTGAFGECLDEFFYVGLVCRMQNDALVENSWMQGRIRLMRRLFKVLSLDEVF